MLMHTISNWKTIKYGNATVTFRKIRIVKRKWYTFWRKDEFDIEPGDDVSEKFLRAYVSAYGVDRLRRLIRTGKN